MDIFLQALLIFILRLIGISVSTLGTILTVQGRRGPAILTGSLSTLVYILAIGQVVTNLSNVWNLAAYVAGYGVGTWVGMALEQRIALGYAEVRIISTQRGDAVAAALRRAGFGATELYGRGRESPVGIVEAIVPRKSVPAVIRLAEEVDERAIVAVSEARTVQRGYWRPNRKR
ncbi:MAG TPA: DUF2179 domain-containing protein [Anaerolineales bacterium]|nr:DUF2179 domain-containing protein [Anaerolineae bacterium]HIQ02701.1 DUF2179 domain-containing protein [Anaerolineales bacterium]